MKNLVLAVAFLGFIMAAFAAIPAGATFYNFDDLTPPGGGDFMNNFAPNYMGLGFSQGVAAIDAPAAQSATWAGIEGAGLFLASGFTDFSLTFPEKVGTVDFMIASPYGNQAVDIGGNLIWVNDIPIAIHLVLNSSLLQITASEVFTFDNLLTTPSAVPIPPTTLLFGTGIVGIFYLRHRFQR